MPVFSGKFSPSSYSQKSLGTLVLLSSNSKKLQTVEQVPWNIPALKDFKAAGEFKTLHG